MDLEFTGGYPCSPTCPDIDKCIAQQPKIQAQRLFLDGILLHCRDSGSAFAVGTELGEEIGSFKDSCRHRFTGCVAEMHYWLDAFPNVTSKHLMNSTTCATTTRLPLHKILIETDAPYLKRTDINSLADTGSG